ncbi:MAG: hypothetical protein QM778_33475 [Myxococcales bacterium]
MLPGDAGLVGFFGRLGLCERLGIRGERLRGERGGGQQDGRFLDLRAGAQTNAIGLRGVRVRKAQRELECVRLELMHLDTKDGGRFLGRAVTE